MAAYGEVFGIVQFAKRNFMENGCAFIRSEPEVGLGGW